MGEILYEKKYPKEDIKDLVSALETGQEQPASKAELSFDEFLKKICGNRVSVLLPERVQAAKAFVRIARRVSELYELDITITEHLDHISADYYFNSAGGLRYLREIVKYADDISFFTNVKGYDIAMCLDFYTHAVFQNGRQLHP